MPLEHQPQLQAVNQLRGGPVATGRFKRGASGNPQTQFKPGNQYRWKPGQSGNPAGIVRSRKALSKGLKTDANSSDRPRQSPGGNSVDGPAGHASKMIPPGIDLYQGELRIHFT